MFFKFGVVELTLVVLEQSMRSMYCNKRNGFSRISLNKFCIFLYHHNQKLFDSRKGKVFRPIVYMIFLFFNSNKICYEYVCSLIFLTHFVRGKLKYEMTHNGRIYHYRYRNWQR